MGPSLIESIPLALGGDMTFLYALKIGTLHIIVSFLQS